MNTRKIAAGGLVAGVCAVAGTLGGIAESSAAKPSKTRLHDTVTTSSTTSSGTQSAGMPPGGGRGGFGGGGPGGRRGGIHSVSVELNKAGTGYVTVTSDSGTIKSVDTTGDTITITEGLAASPYGTPAVSVPSGATIDLDGTTSTLAALVAGDHVSVESSTDGTTTVFATDSSFAPTGAQGGGMGGGGWSGGGHGGPPSASGTSTSTSTSSTDTATSTS